MIKENRLTEFLRFISLTCVIGFGLMTIIATVGSGNPDSSNNYSGTFSGNDNGYWIAILNNTSNVLLTYSTEHIDGDGGYLSPDSSDSSGKSYTSTSLIYGTDFTVETGDGVSVDRNGGNVTYISGSKITGSEQAGSYSGILGGDAAGDWMMSVQSNGYISGSVSIDGETSSFEGGIHPDSSYFVVIGTDSNSDDFVLFGQINGTDVSGGWYSEFGICGDINT